MRIIVVFIFLMSISSVFAQEEIPESEIQISLQVVADGLTLPVAMAAPEDGTGRLFIAQQTGEILVWFRGKVLPRPLLDVSDRMVNVQHRYDERGLLGIALHPNFVDNGRFYVYYSAPTRPDALPETDHTGHISEFRISSQNPNVADPDSERILLYVDEPFGNHNGGQLAFGPEGLLYIGLGDGGDHGDPFGNAQNLDSLLGKIIRLEVEKGGDPEIYAYGLRNPFRFSFDEESGLL
ncbi:MAG: PQQ-dependent sugar dehydrogenase, partial [Anaerolineae bacterium]|nr:PQQ-dependent sugar dehydrogenase [Anaerolineae bacterium]